MTSTGCFDIWTLHDVLTYCTNKTLVKLQCINNTLHDASIQTLDKIAVMHQEITDPKQFGIIFDSMRKVNKYTQITTNKSIKAHKIDFKISQMTPDMTALVIANLMFDGFAQKELKISVNAKQFLKCIQTYNTLSCINIFDSNMLELLLTFRNEKTILQRFELYNVMPDDINIPLINYDICVELDAIEFYNMCKKMRRDGGILLGICHKFDKLTFECINNDGCNVSESIYRMYELKDIIRFRNFALLNKKLKLCIMNKKYPLAIEYMSVYGPITTYITPASTYNIQNL